MEDFSLIIWIVLIAFLYRRKNAQVMDKNRLLRECREYVNNPTTTYENSDINI